MVLFQAIVGGTVPPCCIWDMVVRRYIYVCDVVLRGMVEGDGYVGLLLGHLSICGSDTHTSISSPDLV